jgi:diguanylate cyclase (GGDEF)-like protein
LAAGNLDHRVAIDSTSELNEVGGTFNAMAEALERQREELERQAFTDSLTGLANRALFEDRARHALQRLAGGGQRVAVLVLDVDGFKLVNDGLGHSSGDALLRHAAERMTGVLRPSDTLARLGSDEFAVLLENVRGLDDALGTAERMREAFRDPFILKGTEVVVTASVGIAMSTDSTRDEAELLRRADMAMYRVKQHGRNGCEFFDPAMDDQAADRLAMLNALRRAVERDELVVHYQPIVDLETGDVLAAEALLRWNRPGHGLVSPVEFIPLAEETGVIVSLGEWVLNEACAEARRWGRSGVSDVVVTVNVSARQLLDPSFEAVVAKALTSSGLKSSGLVLEVTESSVIQNADVAVAKLDRISATGVRIALDDFGEGYSSLSHLRQLPIDILKIARPFVRELTEDDHDPALVRGIIELARSLGLRLVAEGIEYPEQQAILRAFDCPLGQGFLFARPMEAEQLREMLGEGRGAQVTG